MSHPLLKQVEASSLKKDVPQFQVGDSVDVHTRIIEGDKERIQVFSGTVIMRKGGGINETFTVRRIVNNEGVERIFPIHSPLIAKVVAKRSGETRRAKLYYLRERVGKAVRLVEKRATKKEEGEAKTPPLPRASSSAPVQSTPHATDVHVGLLRCPSTDPPAQKRHRPMESRTVHGASSSHNVGEPPTPDTVTRPTSSRPRGGP